MQQIWKKCWGILLVGGSLIMVLAAQAELPRRAVLIIRGTQEIARFNAEIADEPEAWRRGLMGRPALALDAAMLFIFPNEEPRAFWMMNTLIPLDMLFIDQAYKIINIQKNAMPCRPPHQCPAYSSKAPARYVLEIAGGRAQALGIQPGDTLHF